MLGIFWSKMFLIWYQNTEIEIQCIQKDAEQLNIPVWSQDTFDHIEVSMLDFDFGTFRNMDQNLFYK